mmetsp:Transcript_32699/g.75259  ORF Transcript_32699/g.75259 Transcript_32699/m.75259 type:complete len:264 (-) Transcript_32699:755-1546(-)
MKASDYDKLGQKEYGTVTAEREIPLHVEALRGERQSDGYRDISFAVIFVVHLIVVLGVSFSVFYDYAKVNSILDLAYEKNRHLLGFVIKCACVTSILTFVAVSLAISQAEFLIKFGLIFCCSMSYLIFQLSPICGGIVFAINSYYACQVWHRIPFAAVNLKTGTTAARSNSGLFLLAVLFFSFGVIWTICWSFSTVSISLKTQCDGDYCYTQSNMYNFIMFLLIISYYWTTQVLSVSVWEKCIIFSLVRFYDCALYIVFSYLF